MTNRWKSIFCFFVAKILFATVLLLLFSFFSFAQERSSNDQSYISYNVYHTASPLAINESQNNRAEFEKRNFDEYVEDKPTALPGVMLLLLGDKIKLNGIRNLLVGIGYMRDDVIFEEIDKLKASDLFGYLRFGGIWVSKLEWEEYLIELEIFLDYAKDRQQNTIVQVNCDITREQLVTVLNKLDSSAIIALENEPDRFSENNLCENITTVDDYIEWVGDTVSYIREINNTVLVMAGSVSSFTEKGEDGLDVLHPWIEPMIDGISNMIDYFAPHYYPFTGAQKLYESAYYVEKLRKVLDHLPANTPPIFIGETNTTYNYWQVYPESGGDSFFSAISIPEIFALKDGAIIGLAHWSLCEPAPSTLGLFSTDGNKRPAWHVLNAISLIKGPPVPALSTNPNVTVTAFKRDSGEYLVFVKNMSYFFEKDTQISVDGLNSSVTLLPLSLSLLVISDDHITNLWRYAYQNQITGPVYGPLSKDELQTVYYAPLADFSEPVLADDPDREPIFIGDDYNQNEKNFSGATWIPLSSPKSTLTVTRDATNGALNLSYTLPSYDGDSLYNQAGVKFSFISQEWESHKLYKNLASGLPDGEIVIDVEADPETTLRLTIEDNDPGTSVEWNIHYVTIQVNARSVFAIPLSHFVQEEGWGKKMHLSDVLKRGASLTVEVRTPGKTGQIKLYSLGFHAKY